MSARQTDRGDARLAGVAVRAHVVEQLNPDQWQAVTKGRFVPADSLEGRAGGVRSFKAALGEALGHSLYTGLPVLVQPLRRPARALMPAEQRERHEMGEALIRSRSKAGSLASIMDQPRPDSGGWAA